MLAAFISPAVVAIAIVCATLLIALFRFTRRPDQELSAAVDQLIEDHQVFHEGLESHLRKIERLEGQSEEHARKLTNLALGKIR